jgi:hypothetical protein
MPDAIPEISGDQRLPGDGNYWSLVQLRKRFVDFSTVKQREIDEARTSWRYYHGLQYTDDQIKVLNDRRQPVITFDRTSRKIDGLVGTVMRLRSDPKAFPRRVGHEQGAELATDVLRFVLDNQRWADIERNCTRDAAVQGIGVCEMGLEPGDHGDPDITLARVDPTTYFYDPRSLQTDFSDIRFEGVARWASVDEIQEMFPDVDADDLTDSAAGAETTQYDFDREFLWINERKRIRLVECWYKQSAQWRFCIYANWQKLAEGDSPFMDERGVSMSRYLKFAYGVDQDGDRYGLIRRLKGPQDAINQHRSKAMHIMNTRQVWARVGTFPDPEKARREAARPDGFIEFEGSPEDFKIEQPAQEFLQQTQYFEDAKSEIENFGPSPALMDSAIKSSSGRALAMMQQNGLAEIGPFIGNYRQWKLSIYRAVWNAVRTHWQAERYIRVIDDDETAQFIAVNAMRLGPNGMPQIINQIGALEVDIILDEGPDSTNVMGDVFDTLSSLAQNQIPVPPQVFIEMSALPKSVKDKVLQMMQQPDPLKQQAAQIELAQGAAKVEDTKAAAGLKQAQAMKAMSDAGMAQAPQGEQAPSLADLAEQAAKVRDTHAAADLKRVQALKGMQDIELAPARMAHEMAVAHHGMMMAERESEKEDEGEASESGE